MKYKILEHSITPLSSLYQNQFSRELQKYMELEPGSFLPRNSYHAIFNLFSERKAQRQTKETHGQVGASHAWYLRNLLQDMGFRNALSVDYSSKENLVWQNFQRLNAELDYITMMGTGKDNVIGFLSIYLLAHGKQQKIQSDRSLYFITCSGADQYNRINIEVLFKKIHLLPAKQIQINIFGCMAECIGSIYQQLPQQIKQHIGLVYLVCDNPKKQAPMNPLIKILGRDYWSCTTPLIIYKFGLQLDDIEKSQMYGLTKKHGCKEQNSQHYFNQMWKYIYRGDHEGPRQIRLDSGDPVTAIQKERLTKGSYFIYKNGEHIYQGPLKQSQSGSAQLIEYGFGHKTTRKLFARLVQEKSKKKGILMFNNLQVYTNKIQNNNVNGLSFLRFHEQGINRPLICRFGHFQYLKQHHLLQVKNGPYLTFDKFIVPKNNNICMQINRKISQDLQFSVLLVKKDKEDTLKCCCSVYQRFKVNNNIMQQQGDLQYPWIQRIVDVEPQNRIEIYKRNFQKLNKDILLHRIHLEYQVEKKKWQMNPVKFTIEDNDTKKNDYQTFLNEYQLLHLFDRFSENYKNQEYSVKDHFSLSIHFLKYQSGFHKVSVQRIWKNNQAVDLEGIREPQIFD